MSAEPPPPPKVSPDGRFYLNEGAWVPFDSQPGTLQQSLPHVKVESKRMAGQTLPTPVLVIIGVVIALVLAGLLLSVLESDAPSGTTYYGLAG